MQLSLIDPRQYPVVTEAMLADADLKSAITMMRRRAGTGNAAAWPYVERLIDVAGRPAWAVDDGGARYVVVGDLVFGIDDLELAEVHLRMAAIEAFRRLDSGRVGDRRRP